MIPNNYTKQTPEKALIGRGSVGGWQFLLPPPGHLATLMKQSICDIASAFSLDVLLSVYNVGNGVATDWTF